MKIAPRINFVAFYNAICVRFPEPLCIERNFRSLLAIDTRLLKTRAAFCVFIFIASLSLFLGGQNIVMDAVLIIHFAKMGTLSKLLSGCLFCNAARRSELT
jgi:hypothetical protein